MSWFSNNATTPITFEQSAAHYEAKGRALGEQPDDPDEIEADDRHPCACRGVFLYGPPDDCPACAGSGFTDTPNDWCDACGLTGACPDCDPDRYRDTALDR